MKPDICIYHGNCADGFTAAWAVWKRFGDAVEYIPGVYGQDPPDVTGKNVVIVDFSYKSKTLEGMSKTAKSILVLDHHKTAQEDLHGIWPPERGPDPWEAFLKDVRDAALIGAPPVLRAVFDMERSGAGIAWDFFHPESDRPDLVRYVEDRDLWRFNLDQSRNVNAYIFAHEYTFGNWRQLHMELEIDIEAVKAAGAAIEKKHHKDVAELVKVTRRMMVIGGHEVPVANMPYTMSSDAGHLMSGELEDQGLHGVGNKYLFAACYWDTAKGRVFSLRSNNSGSDVSKIAKAYGGGGHRNAAGFTMPIGWEGDA